MRWGCGMEKGLRLSWDVRARTCTHTHTHTVSLAHSLSLTLSHSLCCRAWRLWDRHCLRAPARFVMGKPSGGELRIFNFSKPLLGWARSYIWYIYLWLWPTKDLWAGGGGNWRTCARILLATACAIVDRVWPPHTIEWRGWGGRLQCCCAAITSDRR